jgi:hypothetical protein
MNFTLQVQSGSSSVDVSHSELVFQPQHPVGYPDVPTDLPHRNRPVDSLLAFNHLEYKGISPNSNLCSSDFQCTTDAANQADIITCK